MKAKKPMVFHTPKSSKGSGDYYGTAIKQPMARIIEWENVKQPTKSKMGKPPKSLA